MIKQLFSKWLQGIFSRLTDEEIIILFQRKCILILCNVQYNVGFSTHEFNVFVDLDLLMTEVVECFVVCHWAVSYNKLAKKLCVKSYTTNVIEVMRDGSCQPRELYGSLIETFSKDRDLIIDIGKYVKW